MEEMNLAQLYEELTTKKYSDYPFQTKDLREQMALVEEVITGYWKPRFLVDYGARCAYEFMDKNEHPKTVTLNDIAWETMGHLPQSAIEHAQYLNFCFPVFVFQFENGVAQVMWQILPEGRYSMDSDGYGMGSNVDEINIYGFIDRKGRVVLKFQTIEDFKELKMLQKEAEKRVGTSSC